MKHDTRKAEAKRISDPPEGPSIVEARAPDPSVPAAGPDGAPRRRSWSDVRRVLVLQGGGALGSYQAGVYEGLARAGDTLDWVAGISIGAINAALIAGNPPERRVERLRTFWETASSGPFFSPLWSGMSLGRSLFNAMGAASTATFGAPGFFTPRIPGPLLAAPGTPQAISIYDTAPLCATLETLVDFDRLNAGDVRLSVGAVKVATGESVVFDSAKQRIGPEHIMASGALPPGFPPVTIAGELYWDGGIVSNTPLDFVVDETHDDLLIFQVDLFDAEGAPPCNLLEVDEREKDIRFSSRTRHNTVSRMRIHKAKLALQALLDTLPAERADDPLVAQVRDLARENAVAVVQLIYRKRAYEGGAKDYEFSRPTMLEHWASGLADIERCTAHRNALIPNPPQPGFAIIDPRLDG